MDDTKLNLMTAKDVLNNSAKIKEIELIMKKGIFSTYEILNNESRKVPWEETYKQILNYNKMKKFFKNIFNL